MSQVSQEDITGSGLISDGSFPGTTEHGEGVHLLGVRVGTRTDVVTNTLLSTCVPGGGVPVRNESTHKDLVEYQELPLRLSPLRTPVQLVGIVLLGETGVRGHVSRVPVGHGCYPWSYLKTRVWARRVHYHGVVCSDQKPGTVGNWTFSSSSTLMDPLLLSPLPHKPHRRSTSVLYPSLAPVVGDDEGEIYWTPPRTRT